MKWNKITDTHPASDGYYLVLDEIMMVAKFDTANHLFWIVMYGTPVRIFPSHWMDLPEEPQDV